MDYDIQSTKYPPISKLSNFDIGKGLGVGKFGRVFLAKTKKEGYICALKILFKKQLSQCRLERQFQREVEIMSFLDHPNILKLYTWFDDDRRIFLVLEYALYGQMYNSLQRKGRFTDATAAHYVNQLCEALIYIHSHRVIHRDIKPENLLIAQHKVLKLADFGWSVHSQKMRRRTRCGTIDYLPPEIVQQQYYDERVDTWSVGILLYEMLCGKPPFEADTEEATMQYIKELKYSFSVHHKEGARNLIRKILKLSPVDRVTLKGIQQHSWTVHYLNEKENEARK